MSIFNWLLWIILSLFFTVISVRILSALTSYIVADSLTLSSLPRMFINLLGIDRYNMISEFIQVILLVIYLPIFLLYLFLFCLFAMNRRFKRDLSRIMKDVAVISNGNFDLPFKPVFDEDLDIFTSDIQNVLRKLEASMQDERIVEQTKNELITNVSHDLRTPLTSILGYLRYIEQDKYKDEVALRHYTGIAYEKSLQLELLINELFEYTRMQDPKFTFQLEPINLSEILGQLIIQNNHRFFEAEMICRENIPKREMMVLGNGEKLARVFDNLISNAIQYGVSGKYIDILMEEMDEKIVIQIINYGEAISPFDLPHLFDRFYRAEKSRARHTGGTGLGLAISKSIIVHHQGEISVVSNGERTSLIVELNGV